MARINPTPGCPGCKGTGLFAEPDHPLDGTLCVFCVEAAIERGEVTAAEAYGEQHLVVDRSLADLRSKNGKKDSSA